MNPETVSLLFALLRSAIRGTPLTESERASCTAERLNELCSIAKSHDLLHLLALGIKQNHLLAAMPAVLENAIMKAAYRYEQLNYTYDTLVGVLEEAEIPFLPLKGSILRDYYPEPWMRTSCDVDVLVHLEDLDRAVAALTEKGGFSYQGKTSHDVSLSAPNQMSVELHYDLVEEGLANEASAVLAAIWQVVSVRERSRFFYEMPDEYFYFYHIAHMAKHVANGGCGIRPFIDLWILDRMDGADETRRKELLAKGRLQTFADAARILSRVWMEGDAPDLLSHELEAYLLCGGVYGTMDNRVAIQQTKKGGKLRYAFSRIWLPYDIIKFHYPILQKRRWLLPFMQVRRWGKLIFCGGLRRSANELHTTASLSSDRTQRVANLLKNLEI